MALMLRLRLRLRLRLMVYIFIIIVQHRRTPRILIPLKYPLGIGRPFSSSFLLACFNLIRDAHNGVHGEHKRLDLKLHPSILYCTIITSLILEPRGAPWITSVLSTSGRHHPPVFLCLFFFWSKYTHTTFLHIPFLFSRSNIRVTCKYP